jgi:hypothetical protein
MRFDIYRPIHKALRLSLSKLLVKLGSTDFRNEAAATEAIAALRQQIALSRSHLEHEERFIHPLLEPLTDKPLAALEADHRHHEQSLDQLDELACAIEDAEAEERLILGHSLYLQFSRFLAEDLVHMAEEETSTLALLHRHFTDAELQEIEGRIVAAHPPEKLMGTLCLMIPGMNLPERVQFLRGIKASAPPEAFKAIVENAAKPSLTSSEWNLLRAQLQDAA